MVHMDGPLERPPFPAFEPTYTVSGDAWDAVRRIERADATLAGIPIADEQRERIYRDALARNAYATARIEGNLHTLQEVTQLLNETLVPTDRQAPDELEYLTWRAVMQDIDGHAVPRTTGDLDHLHAILFTGVLPAEKRPGQLKDRPNVIGNQHGVTYVPTTPERTPLELQNALDWYHTSPEHPIIRATVLCHEFEAIHPYLDGNGRLGRLLLGLCLYHAGYPHIVYAPVDYAINADRGRYYDELARVEEDWDLSPWIDYLVGLLAEVYEATVDRFRFLQGLDDLPGDALDVARWLHQHTRRRWVRFGNVHEAFPQISRRTLQRHLARLVERGVLLREGERKATRYRVA